MSNEETIKELMHIELDRFHDDELEDGVTIAISVDGFQHSLSCSPMWSWKPNKVCRRLKMPCLA